MFANAPGESLKVRLLALAALAPLLVSTALVADGPGAYAPKERSNAASEVSASAEALAAQAYADGYAAIQRADHQASLASAAVNDAERADAHRKAQAEYAAAVGGFEAAVRHDPTLSDAHTYLGYARRKLGRYEQALDAYDRALELDPQNVYAIEYQGEAFLALDRLDEARFNYLRLYALDEAQAAKLLSAMRAWIAARAQEPAAVAPEKLQEFKAWLDARSANIQPTSVHSGW